MRIMSSQISKQKLFLWKDKLIKALILSGETGNLEYTKF